MGLGAKRYERCEKGAKFRLKFTLLLLFTDYLYDKIMRICVKFAFLQRENYGEKINHL